MFEEDKEFAVETRVAADHPCLAGHFPGRPIVPAVLLLDLIAEAIGAEWCDVRIGALAGAKFLAPVLPGQAITIRIAVSKGNSVRFRCLVGDGLVAHGEFSLTPIGSRA